MKQLTVLPLGISSAVPTRERNLSSTALLFDGRSILFDCGEATQHQIVRSPVRLGRLEAVLISHLHGDHLYGLPGLLATLSMRGRTEPLALLGPDGLKAFVESAAAASRFVPLFELIISEIEAGEVFRGSGYTIHAAELEHRVRCFGFLFIEDDRPGRFDRERARERGVPEGPLYGQLHRGIDVVLDDGRLVRADEITGPARRGRRIAYVTDTVPCKAAVELARGADLLIHEATYASDMAAEARERWHSTAAEAASIAREAAVGQLLLTHFSPRYGDPEELAREAREIFAATRCAVELEPVAMDTVE
jgi:ribonuclease Z